MAESSPLHSAFTDGSVSCIVCNSSSLLGAQPERYKRNARWQSQLEIVKCRFQQLHSKLRIKHCDKTPDREASGKRTLSDSLFQLPSAEHFSVMSVSALFQFWRLANFIYGRSYGEQFNLHTHAHVRTRQRVYTSASRYLHTLELFYTRWINSIAALICYDSKISKFCNTEEGSRTQREAVVGKDEARKHHVNYHLIGSKAINR